MSDTESGNGKEVGLVELGRFDPEPGMRDDPARLREFVHDGRSMRAMAKAIAESRAYRHTNENTVLTIMLAAYELDIGVGTALKGMYPVSGKLELETWLLAGLAIMRTGVRWDDIEVSDHRVVLQLHREGWEPKEVEYNLGHAAKMGLIRDYDPETHEFKTAKATDPWRRSTEEMLYWRALSKGLKRIAPDYFGGLYVRGELSAEIIDEMRTPKGRADLDALMHGVEPDDDEMSEDEMDAYASEVRAAHKAELIDSSRADELYALAIDGKWSEARGAWDEIRSLIARAEADSEGQGALAV